MRAWTFLLPKARTASPLDEIAFLRKCITEYMHFCTFAFLLVRYCPDYWLDASAISFPTRQNTAFRSVQDLSHAFRLRKWLKAAEDLSWQCSVRAEDVPGSCRFCGATC